MKIGVLLLGGAAAYLLYQGMQPQAPKTVVLPPQGVPGDAVLLKSATVAGVPINAWAASDGYYVSYTNPLTGNPGVQGPISQAQAFDILKGASALGMGVSA